MDELSRRTFTKQSLGSLLTYSLLQSVCEHDSFAAEVKPITPEPITAEEKLQIVRLQRQGEQAVASVQAAAAASNKAVADANAARVAEKEAEIDRIHAQAALDSVNGKIDRLTADLHESYGAPTAKWRLTPDLEWERKAPIQMDQ